LDDARREFVSEHFREDIDDPHAYDLILDTNRLTVRQAASAILTMIRTPVYSDEADVGH
jgi:cytidylate kinase